MSLIADIKAIQKHVGVKSDGVFGPVSAAAVRASLSNASKPLNEEKLVPARKAKYFNFDERTEKHVASLSPAAQKKFRPFIAQAQAIAAAMGVDYIAISGYRSNSEQDALYAKGRSKPGPRVTNVRGGYSNHNHRIAVDFGVFRRGKYLDGSEPKTAHRVHAAVAQLASKHGIEWGGNWRSFKDTPHYEIKTNLTMAQKRALTAKGRDVAA